MIEPSLLHVIHQQSEVMNNLSLTSMVCVHQELAQGSRYLENMYFLTNLSHIAMKTQCSFIKHSNGLISLLIQGLHLSSSGKSFCPGPWLVKRLDTALLQGELSGDATSCTTMVQSIQHIVCSHISVEKETAELGLP